MLAEVDQHEVMNASFTEAGTLAYDAALNAFSYRYLVTDDAETPGEADANAATKAELLAVEDLEERNVEAVGIKVSVVSIDDMQASTRRLQ